MSWGWNRDILRSSLLNGIPGLVHGVSSTVFGNMRSPVNLMKFTRKYGITKNFTVVRGRQTHGKNIAVVNGVNSRSLKNGVVTLSDTDGLITCGTGRILCILHADCAPVFLIAPRDNILVALHVGWRGFVGGILVGAIKLLERKFAVETKEIIAGIGPHIGQCCYEVGWEVARKFPCVCRVRFGKKWRIDLGKSIMAQMLEYGINRRNIDLCCICTYEEEKLFSFRRNETDDRMAAVVGWQF